MGGRPSDSRGLGLFAQHFPPLRQQTNISCLPPRPLDIPYLSQHAPSDIGSSSVSAPAYPPTAPLLSLFLLPPPLPILLVVRFSLTCLVVDLRVHGQAGRREREKVAFNYTCPSYPAANKWPLRFSQTWGSTPYHHHPPPTPPPKKGVGGGFFLLSSFSET